ncbi:hypothetical protein GGS21DRAFT_452804 [Xylaria nigripes]|nr:hypothetical protein GGS21DRAFT_452804 [Xylaria nigripes]
MLTPWHRSVQQQNSTSSTVPPVRKLPTTGRTFQPNLTYERPVSSVYSQPSPVAAEYVAHQSKNEAYPNALEVSPPSSPGSASSIKRPDPGDVSPIDETPDTFQLDKRRYANSSKTEPRSNVPTIRPEQSNNSDAAISSIREDNPPVQTASPRPFNEDIRQGPRMEGSVTRVRGRPSQLNPQDVARGFSRRANVTSSLESRSPQPSQPNLTALRDRLRPVRQTSTGAQPEPAPRPEWKGASGRTVLVPPVKDNLSVVPLNIPPKSSKRASRSPQVLPSVESRESQVVSTPLQTEPETREQQFVHNKDTAAPFAAGSTAWQPAQAPAPAPKHQPSPPTSAYPTPSPSPSENIIREDRPPGKERTITPSQLPPLLLPSNDKAIRRKPARASSAQHQDSFVLATQAARSSSYELTQPSCTYASSNRTATPRTSFDADTHPLPTPPQLNTPTLAPQTAPTASILNRGRPIVSGYEKSPSLTPHEPVKISLDSSHYTTTFSTTTKPRPDGLRPLMSRANNSTLSVESESSFNNSLDKSLPPVPPEASATDRVAGLNAQLGALGNRRMNINTAIRQMTEMMPTDNILASEAVVRKREAEKRKVELLRTELAEVERQFYELGLKLHRAYKRLDRDAKYEPTTLWVRRVTN